MDNKSMAWLSDLDLEEPGHIMKQHQQSHPYYTDSVDSFSSRSLIDSPSLIKTNQSTQLATTNTDVDKQHDYKVTKSSPLAPRYGSISNTFSISFGNPTSTREMNEYDLLYEGSRLKHTVAATPKEETSLTQFSRYMDDTRMVRNTKRNHRQAQEHVVAERKRREKLARRFISLSALLPEFKKNDKATVLEDASKYILQLQARVKELEETLNEIQKLQMTIICCSILPFNTGHIITVTAQMGDEMVTKRKDLVKYLQIALKDLL